MVKLVIVTYLFYYIKKMIKSITILFLIYLYTDAYSNVLNKIIPIKCRDNKVLNTSVIIHDHIISAKYDDDNDKSINDINGNNLFYKGEVIVNYKTYPEHSGVNADIVIKE